MFILSTGKLYRSCKHLVSGFIVVLVLAGCVRADKPALSLEARQGLRLTRADVGFAPGAVIHVSAVEDQATARMATPQEVAAAQRDHVVRVLSAEFMAVVGPRLAGVRPVVAKIVVNRFYIPGAMAALFVGGSSEMQAGVDLVDEQTGEVLASIPSGRIANSVYRPGGVIGVAVQAAGAGDPAEIKTREMAQKFASEYVQWLMER